METLAPLEDACTVVMLRDGPAGLETLMLERPHTSSSFAGAWVFPGGRVDPEDRAQSAGAAHDDLIAAQVAGLREVAEETGQHLSRENLVWFSQWTPMHSIPRRFRTWFMLAAAGPEAVVLNQEEHSRFLWLTPAEALARHARGAMVLVAPTWVTLHNLSTAETVAQALAAARNAPPFSYNSYLLNLDGENPGRSTGSLWLGDEQYPGPADPHSPAPRPGARHRLITARLPWVYQLTDGEPALGPDALGPDALVCEHLNH